jgi:outer membrane protein
VGTRRRYNNETILALRDLHGMKKISAYLAATAFLSLLSFSSFAEDLLSVYKLAIQNDSQFRASQAERLAQLESKTQSMALLLPSLSASAHYTEHDNETIKSSVSASKYKTNGYSLTLTQPLYRHENFVGLNHADAQVAQAEAVFKHAEQDLIIRVATRYFAVLAAEDDLQFAKAERKAISEQLIQTQQRFNVGLIAITDVHEAQARFDQAVARAIVAENTVAISYETLREITAKDHSALAILSTKLPLLEPEPADIKQWVETAKSQNAVLMASKKSVDVAKEEVSRQSSGHYPSLDLTASNTYSNNGDGVAGGANEQNNNTVSLQLTVPLYQGGLINSRTRAAAHSLTQAREKLEQQNRATERQTRNSYLSVIANISQVKALRQALASSLIALEATQAGFDVGTRTAVAVLDSQRDLFRARRDYAQVRYNYVLETLRLKLAAGTLSVTDIEQLNPWLK